MHTQWIFDLPVNPLHEEEDGCGRNPIRPRWLVNVMIV